MFYDTELFNKESTSKPKKPLTCPTGIGTKQRRSYSDSDSDQEWYDPAELVNLVSDPQLFESSCDEKMEPSGNNLDLNLSFNLRIETKGQ